jgi:PAS domain S-box-containing protein
MSRKDFRKFFLSIVLPSVIAISLFVLTIFVVILPNFEQSIMEKKKEMISELTHSVTSLLEEYNQEYINNKISKAEAQKIALSKIEQIRYGGENKDYFWIIDETPIMIMHPYRHELINTDLTNYADPNGKKLFVEASKVVKENGHGFINYMWQWKDDSTLIVPKLSYVKSYQPWGWIIGTGIYLEDVKQEITSLEKHLVRITLFISLLLIIILSYVIRQSLKIENKRKKAETKLLLSKQKYKSLVAASSEGTLMILDKHIIFSNIKFSNLVGYETHQLLSLKFEDIFSTDWEYLVSSFANPKKSQTLETKIKCNDGSEKEVILSVSKIKYASDFGYIIITKEITHQKQIEKETEQLNQELQTSLLLMHQPLKSYVNEIIKCSIETSIEEAVLLMTRKKRNILFVHKENEIIGIINNNDLKKRVLAQKLNTQNPVMEIMTSPVIFISENALIYEAVLLLKRKNISHLAIKNQKSEIKGVISYVAIISLQQNVVSYLIKEIEYSENFTDLVRFQKRVAVIVNALIESGDRTHNITRIISSVADAILTRIISLTIEDLGEPPCDFAFMVMGSEGRMEQTLFTDQDNAIVFENLEEDKLLIARSYFQNLGEEVSNKLNEVGYNYCKGDIMAKNPKWVQPLSVWKDYFSRWINTSDPKSILDACIFFDFRFVHGNSTLIDDLRFHVNNAITHKSIFFYHLAQSITNYKPPLNLFGKIIGAKPATDHLYMDVKKILLPVTGFVRLYALYYKLHETNTLDRIEQLYFKGVIVKGMYNDLVLTYNYLMHLRLHNQTKKMMQNKTPDNLINIEKLAHIEIATIKKLFASINKLQTKLNVDFKSNV